MAAELVILDTSIWIEYFHGKAADLCQDVDALIATRRLRHLTVITAELLRGAVATRERRIIAQTVAFIPRVPLTDEFWMTVGEFCFDLARQGVVAHLIDAWIAKAAINARCALWSLDHHFSAIARRTPLRLYGGEVG
ncbi:MAG: PIN domain-containing protein [Deltaproteobacteria bacterium]|nr:PIN domain-containing protein [Deltaproteobacteria bacterium]